MTDLLHLAERCEREEPSRELDGAIGLALNPGAWLWTPEWWSGGPNEYLRWPDPTPNSARYDNLPRYTTSLDSAVTLVPGECAWSVNWEPIFGSRIRGDASVFENGGSGEDHQANAKSPALALCAAALRARAVLKETP